MTTRPEVSDERTPLQIAAKRVWESLLDASGHLSDLREVDDGNEPFNRVERQLERVFESLAEYMHEDDCHE